MALAPKLQVVLTNISPHTSQGSMAKSNIHDQGSSQSEDVPIHKLFLFLFIGKLQPNDNEF